jgi:predicted phage tail protein
MLSLSSLAVSPIAWPHRLVGLGLATTALIGLAAACSEVVVTPVDVASIDVLPAMAEVGVGENVQLSVELHDAQGRKVTGHPITWSSDDDTVATVNSSGQVSGATAGTTTIRARSGRAEGVATVQVLAPPSIVVSQNTVSFVANSGGPPPPGTAIAITNGGQGELTGLAVATDYGSGPGGWVSTSLSRTTAPATLTVGVQPGTLPAGTYQATVNVSATSAPGPAVPITVSMEVEEVVIVADVPDPPENLTAELTEPDAARLSWSPRGPDATEFRIERRVGNGGFQARGTVDGSSTTFVDSGLQPDTRYTYRVRACNASGCSNFSNEATAETAPAAPVDLRVAMLLFNRVRIAWTYEGTTAITFRIERATGSGSFSELATVGADASFYDDRDVQRGVIYRYRVSACNSSGCSATSNTITVTVPN